MNRQSSLRELVLLRLADGCPALTPDCGRSLAEQAAVCLEERGHGIRVGLQVVGEYQTAFELVRPDVSAQMRRCYNDPEEATERGAYGVAILLIRDLAGFTTVERSRKGTGFDYWLGMEEDPFFQKKARLEVSGIREGDEKLRARVNQKINQTRRSDQDGLPAFIVVVLFSRPLAQVVKRERR